MGSKMPYDFIVVGSGPAGACLASRLASSKRLPSVLLLEAGGVNSNKNIRLLADRYDTFGLQDLNWGYKTVPQKNLNGRQVDYSRGKGLGGSSAINFALYTVGPRDDYDEWARIVGDNAFSWQNARKCYDKLETYSMNHQTHLKKYLDPSPLAHGSAGPLPISFPQTWEKGFFELLDAAEAFGMHLNPDTNSGDPIGIGITPSTAANSTRVTASSVFLEKSPINLTIMTDSPVSKVLFDRKRAIGVISNGRMYTVSREVIISAGAVNTPQLLLLSGVGPQDELAVHEIECVHHLPGVGKNLQDRYIVPLIAQRVDGTNDRAALLTNPSALTAAREQFDKDGTGPLTVIFNSLILGWVRNNRLFQSNEFMLLPTEVQTHLRRPTVPSYEIGTYTRTNSPLADISKDYLTVSVIGMSVQSTGTITLASADPNDAPVCDPNAFSSPFDRLNAIEGVKYIMDFMNSPAVAKDIIQPFSMPASTSDEDIWLFIQENSKTSWHMSCTAKMGKIDDPTACVDNDFKVFGLKSLRVVDMSVTPFITNCHVVAVAYLVGEIAAEKIIQEYGLDNTSETKV
ncbi:GMC oxidoreductase [Glonium stellatum]|uniref:GMC oxidoreductase n=1 Tax=Glonium stellatum TaxID=574774 RepID=A0A8E2JYA4_9PEZI|nr:GMC oxidoreductase [Glonium stellatum]